MAQRLAEYIQNAKSEAQSKTTIFKYPEHAIMCDDILSNTFTLEDQIKYFTENVDELERRIMMLFESENLLFFKSETEMTLMGKGVLYVFISGIRI